MTDLTSRHRGSRDRFRVVACASIALAAACAEQSLAPAAPLSGGDVAGPYDLRTVDGKPSPGWGSYTIGPGLVIAERWSLNADGTSTYVDSAYWGPSGALVASTHAGPGWTLLPAAAGAPAGSAVVETRATIYTPSQIYDQILDYRAERSGGTVRLVATSPGWYALLYQRAR